jgi:hypothetical protein
VEKFNHDISAKVGTVKRIISKLEAELLDLKSTK